MSLERIDKLITSQGTLSRTEAKKLIKANLVRANGQAVKRPEEKFDTTNVQIEIDGRLLEYKKYIYIMLNKPKGVVSASRDNKTKTVVDLVPDNLLRNGLFPAGRLDADTTGFVLITDDGEFAHDILSPKNHIEKTYKATLAHEVTGSDIKMFEQGIELSDGTKCMSAKVEIFKTQPEPVVIIKICEGKYHQIKRMFAATGNKVVELKRIAMGNLPLDTSLEPGECREISKEELNLIKYLDKNL